MASVINDPNGRRRIQFTAPDGLRKTIRLGKCDRKSAEAICRHVEQLLSAKIGGQPIPRTSATWLMEIGTQLRDKLAAVGLTESVAKVPTLKEFLESHLEARNAELKPNTMTVMRQAARWMLCNLEPEKRLDKFTPADADYFRSQVLQGRARATANKWTRYAREFFTAAFNRGIITINPFAHIKGLAVVGDQSRRVFIPLDEIEKVMEVIPCPQFRLIVALARFGGLRCPSEVLALTWSDVNWEKDRLIVRASKTPRDADLQRTTTLSRSRLGHCQGRGAQGHHTLPECERQPQNATRPLDRASRARTVGQTVPEHACKPGHRVGRPISVTRCSEVVRAHRRDSR